MKINNKKSYALAVFVSILTLFSQKIMAQCTNLAVNGSFENSSGQTLQIDASLVPGWTTTASDNKIEIWDVALANSWSTSPYLGNQFAELNATQTSTLSQNFSASAGDNLTIKFAHRGRTGVDVMSVAVGPVGGPYTTIGNYSDGNTAWGVYSVGYLVPNTGTIQVRFTAVSTANGIDTWGNFIDAVEVYLIPKPVISGTSSGCPSSNINFTVSPTSYSTYSWSASSGTVASGQGSSSISANWGTAGAKTVSLTVTNASGCSSTADAYNVTINNCPACNAGSTAPTLTSNSLSNACGATTVNLNSSVSSSTPSGTSLVWFTNNTHTGGAYATPTAAGVGQYYAFYYDATNNCYSPATSALTVTINAAPTVAAITGTPSGNLCAGSTVQLSNATVGGVWSSSNISFATVSSTGLVTGTGDGVVTISYTVTNGSGCTAVATTTITASFNGTTNGSGTGATICVGSTATFTGVGTWSTTSAAIATVNTSGVVMGVSAGNVTIRRTSVANCVTTNMDFPVTVNALPTVAAITGSPSGNLCFGSTVQLSNATAGGVWSSSNISTATVSSTGLVTGTGDGVATISYTKTDGNGCTAVATTNITASFNANQTGFAAGATICSGSTATLTGIGTWSSTNPLIATVNSSGVVTGVSAGNVIIKTTSISNCVTTTIDYPVTINNSCCNAGTTAPMLTKN